MQATVNPSSPGPRSSIGYRLLTTASCLSFWGFRIPVEPLYMHSSTHSNFSMALSDVDLNEY